MAKDVIITPADGDIQFENSTGTEAGKIEQSGDDLVLSNAVGDILIGDGTADVYIGDGAANVDIVFEQNGSIRGEAGSSVDITLGSSDTDVIISGSTFNIDPDATFDGDVTANSLIKSGGSSTEFLKADGSVDTSTYLTTLPTHNHDGRYLRTHTRYQDDLDTITTSGVYIWDVSEADDEPTGASDGLLTIKYWDSTSWATANFQDFHANKLYIKSKQSGTWQTDWAQVWTTDQLTTTNKTNYDTAYTYSQVGHLPLAGGTMTGDLTVSNGNAIPISITGTNSSYTALAIKNTSTGAARVYFDASNGDLAGGDYSWVGQNDDLNLEIANSGNAGRILFTESGGERMTISNGNVGIGQTNPQSLLHVGNGSGVILSAGLSTWADNAVLSNGWTSGVGDWLKIEVPSSDNESGFIQLNSNGNVGIGNTSPDYKLDVAGDIRVDSTSVAQIFLDSAASNDAVLNFHENASQKGKIGYDTSLGGIALVAGSGAFSTADMVLLDSGNVGIGTTSPGAKLHVDGTAIFDTQTGAQPFYITRDGVANQALKIYVDDAAAVFESIQDETADDYGSFIFKMDDGTTHPYFDIRKGNATQVRFDGSGNVGIGTTSPVSKLELYEVSGVAPTLLTLHQYAVDIVADDSMGSFIDFKSTDIDANFTPQARIGMLIRDSSGDSGVASEGCGNLVFHTSRGTNSTGDGVDVERMRITDIGNVGIGTTNPSSTLEVYGSGSTVLDIQGSQGQLFSITDDLTGDLFTVSDISGVPIFNVNATGLATVDGEMSIGLNGATPVYTLDVGGDIGTDRYIRHNGDSNTYFGFSGADTIQFNTNSGERLRIDSAGDITFKGDLLIGNTAMDPKDIVISQIGVSTTETTALMHDQNGRVVVRNLGSNAFNSTAIPTDFVSKANGGTFSGALKITDALNSGSPILDLHNSTNGEGTDIRFTDVAAGTSQFGNITYRHQDSKSYGSGASFTIGSGEASTTILADGKLMYNEGIYSKPATGTGAGTRKDSNWDAAYTHSTSTHAPTNAEANVQSDWNATSGDAFILNKPTIPTDHGDHDGLYLPIGGGTLTGNLNIPEYLYHAGDTDTYLRFRADDLQLVAGGRNIIRMDEGTDPDKVQLGDSSTVTYTEGSVGIGTVGPQTKLQVVYTDSHVSGDLSISNSAFDIYNNSSSDVAGKGSTLTFSDNYSSINKTTRAAIKGGTQTAGNTANGFLAFYIDSSSANSMQERMRIINTGYVGIGTTGPSTLLHTKTLGTSTTIPNELRIESVNTSGYGGESILNLYTSTYGNPGVYFGNQAAITSQPGYIKYIGSSNQLQINAASIQLRRNGVAKIDINSTNTYFSGNNVGIKTTNPSTALEVSGTTTTQNLAFQRPTGDNQFKGEIVTFGSQSGIAQGDIVAYNSSGQWVKAQANSGTTSKNLLGVAMGTTAAAGILLRGFVRDASFGNQTPSSGQHLYLSTSTAGDYQTAVPSTTGHVARVIGYSIAPTNEEIYFCPDNTFVEIA